MVFMTVKAPKVGDIISRPRPCFYSMCLAHVNLKVPQLCPQPFRCGDSAWLRADEAHQSWGYKLDRNGWWISLGVWLFKETRRLKHKNRARIAVQSNLECLGGLQTSRKAASIPGHHAKDAGASFTVRGQDVTQRLRNFWNLNSLQIPAKLQDFLFLKSARC